MYLKVYLSALLFLMLFISNSYSQNLKNIKDQKPISISGSLSLRGVAYQSIGRETSRDPFSWYLTGNPIINIYGIVIPLSLTISDQNKSYSQPLNTIGASPYYKWLTLHLGYRTLQFGKYTLSGNTMLGAGFEINHPSGLQFGFVSGRFNKAINYEYDEDEEETSVTPEYKQTGSCLKLGYAKQGNFITFSVLKGHDHENSISSEAIDSLNIYPEENVVLGLSGKYTFKKKLTFQLEMGNSLYTNNIYDTTGAVTNNNFIGERLSGLITTNASTINATAIEAKLTYKEKLYGAKLKFKRIGDDYQSMGTYYFQNDVQNITISPWVALWKKKLRVNASVGVQKNNLTSSTGTKSTRLIKSLKVNVRPVKWYSLNAAYSDYETEKIRRIERLDSIYQQTQTTQRINLNQFVNFTTGNHNHSIMANYSLQKMESMDERITTSTTYNSQTLMVGYNYTYNPIMLNADISYNYSGYETNGEADKTTGWDFGLSKRMLDKKLRLNFDYSRDKQFEADAATREIERIKFKATWQVVKRKHYINFRFTNKAVNALEEDGTSYTTRLFNFGYQYRF